PGEIQPINFHNVDLGSVRAMGAFVLTELTLMDQLDDFVLEEQFKVEVFDSRHHDGENDDYLLSELHQLHLIYKNLLRKAGVEFSYFKSWLIHGKISNIPWHIDKAGDVRFLLNI